MTPSIPRLTTETCISVGIHHYKSQNIPVYFLHKGDPTRGQLYLSFVDLHQTQTIYTAEMDWDNQYEWSLIRSFNREESLDFSLWHQRLCTRDPDHWLLEIESDTQKILFPLPE